MTGSVCPKTFWYIGQLYWQGSYYIFNNYYKMLLSCSTSIWKFSILEQVLKQQNIIDYKDRMYSFKKQAKVIQ